MEILVDIQVLEVSSRESSVCNDLDLSIANLGDGDGVTEVSDTAVNLDLVLKELLERGDVKDLVGGGLRSVDDELLTVSPKSPTPASSEEIEQWLTLFVTLACLPLADFYTKT